MPDDTDPDGSRLSRRGMLQVAVATTASLSTAGLASAADDDPTGPLDEPLPGPTIAPMGFDCDPETHASYTEVSREPTHDFGEETVVELPSARDGEKILLGYIRPEPLDDDQTDGDYPVILRATPYVSDLRKADSLRDCTRIERLTENFVQQGYAVAVVSVRGTGGSGGCMELFGANEQADVDQAVTYLGEQPWSNGNVGIVGRSYDGSTPWMPARAGNPHLKTMVPFSGVTDIFELMYKRGAPESRGYAVLPALYYVISLAEHSPGSGTGLETYLSRAACPDNYAQGTAWSLYSGASGNRDPSGYWTERVLKPGVARNYEGSILLVHGLQDWNVDPSQVYPWVNDLQEAGIKTHVYFGQFGHRYPDDGREKGEANYNEQWADYLLAWFESELNGEEYVGEFPEHDGIDPETAYDPVPEVYAQRSDGDWYTAESWPPEAAEPRTLYLGSDGDVRPSPDPQTGTGTVYTDGTTSPAPGARGCVTVETEPFDAEFRLAGVPTVEVTATPTSSAPHLTTHLFSVAPDGTAERLGWGQVDLRFAKDRPRGEPVVPGEAIDVRIPIEPLDAVVPAGHRLAVVLNQGTVSGRVESPTPTPIQVQTGGDAALTVEAWGDDLPGASFAVAGSRTSDASAFTGGQTTTQRVTVRATDPVAVRDTVPADWNVLTAYSDDVARVETDADAGVTRVVFADDADGETTFEYLAEAPEGADASGLYTLGPVEAEVDGEWETVAGTTSDVVVAGPRA
ncbi:CocE/NonD family hydrolase [Halorarius halobius]|uniref:CocE/NonD family hydrolase n=1 Tax=Halorarius halobius TaxID=2962671 RepID=UPI0020CF7073|nr:CocE/NonD family hydrolase [Halorarius halobius]